MLNASARTVGVPRALLSGYSGQFAVSVWGPGALAVVSSLLAAWYFFIPPLWSFAVDARALPDLLAFALTAALILAILRRIPARARRSPAQLRAVQDAAGDLVGRACPLSRRPRRRGPGGGFRVSLRQSYRAPDHRQKELARPRRRLAADAASAGARASGALPTIRRSARYRRVLQTEYELGGQWYQSAVARLYDGVVVTVQRITERKHAEFRRNRCCCRSSITA